MSDDEVTEGDVALLRAVREGDAAAFGRLYERHAGAALVVARQYTDSVADAEDVVSDAFAKVHAALRGGHGPEAAFRAYLFTVVRRVAAVHRDAGRRTEPTDDVAVLETAATPVEAAEEPALAGFERSLVARAFRSLPERWQEVLWHSEVEGLTPAQIAPIVGLTANSTAALAYRAREGLRQAYLQQHLQDPASDGCRAVSGKLGAYVRGGLGARDTRAVEQHLDDCGDCRALVLELGDVSHGMRAVVAPLVLGLLGLGALAHELPVGGGLVAGAALVGGSGAAGGAPAAAGGGAASGTGAAGGGLAGTAAAPAAVGGALGTGGAVGGGVLGGLSAGAVATVVGAAVVVAAAAFGVVQLLTGPTQDGTDVAGASESAPETPGPAARPTSRPASQRPTASPADLPPLDAPQDEPQDEVRPDGGPRWWSGRARDPYPRPERDVVVAGAPDPTAAPEPDDVVTSAPATEPSDPRTPAPSPEPTGPATPEATPSPRPTPTSRPTPGATPTPAPAPARVVVAAPEEGLTLVAGAADQRISLAVSNVGGSSASGLTADVALPDGMTVVPTAGAQGLRGLAVAGSPWLCVTADAGSTATCTLDELAPGASADLVLGVDVDESYLASGDEAVRIRITGADHTWEPAPIGVRVAASPPRLVFDEGVPADVQVVVGRSRTLDLPVRNAGGTAVDRGTPATVEIDLPPDVSVTGAAPWRCARTLDTVACRHSGLGGFEPATLRLTLTSPSTAEPGSGVLPVRLAPSGHRAPETRDVTFTRVRPAVLGVETPDGAELAAGVPADVPVAVVNSGDLAAAGASLALAAPAGVTVVDAGGDGWACTLDASPVTCTGDVAPGDRADLVARLDVTPGLVGDLGDATLTVSAPEADTTAGTRTLPLTAAAPVLGVTDLTAVMSADGTGTVAFAVASERAGATGVVARVELPAGVEHDPGSASPTAAACTAEGRVVTCEPGDLTVGAPGVVEVPVRAAGAVLGTVRVELTATGAEPAVASTRLVAASGHLVPVWSGTGDLDVTEVGAPLLVCVDVRGDVCDAVRRERDNNGLDMQPLDQAPPAGPRAAVPVSSQTRLDVPDGRPVVWAGLYWSAVRGPDDAWSGQLDTARLRAPDGTWTDVRATSVLQQADTSGRRYYQATVDVTDLVARGGAGTWALADAAVSAGRTDRAPTYYAGWALVVVHGTPGAEAGGSTVTVHQGASWIGSNSVAPAFVFVGEAGARTRVGVVAWEGDRATSGDRLSLAGVGALTPQRWDASRVVGGGSAGNAFDSTATGWQHPNALGVDAKGFAEVRLPSGVGALTPSTAGDQYLIGAVTVRTTPGDS